MKPKAPTAWLLAGMAVAAATPGIAAAQGPAKLHKQPMSIEQRKALGESMAFKNRHFTTPRTMAEANRTFLRRPNGVESVQVPTELWSHLHAQTDAQGNVRIVESSSDAAPAAAEGLDHE